MECQDLRLRTEEADDAGVLVVKLMTDEDSWVKELESRAIVPPERAKEIIVPVLSAAAAQPTTKAKTELSIHTLSHATAQSDRQQRPVMIFVLCFTTVVQQRCSGIG